MGSRYFTRQLCRYFCKLTSVRNEKAGEVSPKSERLSAVQRCRGIQRCLGFLLFSFMASTGAGSSPVCGGSFVMWLVKSMAILSDPMPRITRWAFGSRAIILLLLSWIGTTLGVIDMHTAWRMLAAHCQSLHSSPTDLSHNSCSGGSTAGSPNASAEIRREKEPGGFHPALIRKQDV